MNNREKKANSMLSKRISITLELEQWVHLKVVACAISSKMLDPEKTDVMKELAKDMTPGDFKQMILTTYLASEEIGEIIGPEMMKMYKHLGDVDA